MIRTFVLPHEQRTLDAFLTANPVHSIHLAPPVVTVRTDADINPVPFSVSARQIRQALTHFNMRASVEASVAAGTQDLKDWWDSASVFEREHPLVIGMAQTLGVSDAQLDALWIYANSI